MFYAPSPLCFGKQIWCYKPLNKGGLLACACSVVEFSIGSAFSVSYQTLPDATVYHDPEPDNLVNWCNQTYLEYIKDDKTRGLIRNLCHVSNPSHSNLDGVRSCSIGHFRACLIRVNKVCWKKVAISAPCLAFLAETALARECYSQLKLSFELLKKSAHCKKAKLTVLNICSMDILNTYFYPENLATRSTCRMMLCDDMKQED